MENWLKVARFWSAVEVGGANQCWNWKGSKRHDGYGAFNWAGSSQIAHRAAYEFAVGPIPGGAVLRHGCDNPLCCNPKHLLTGTQADNIADAVLKRRHAFGRRSGQAKLTEEEVLAISKDSRSHSEIALAFRVTPTLVGQIKRVQIWTSVPRERGHTNSFAAHGEKSGMAKLTWAMVAEIRSSIGSHGELAKRYGVTKATIWKIKSGRTWTAPPDSSSQAA